MSQQNCSIKATYKPQSYVVLFGPPTDPQVQQSAELLKKQGREVVTIGRPQFDTGIGNCGHICSCKETCKQKIFGVTNQGKPVL